MRDYSAFILTEEERKVFQKFTNSDTTMLSEYEYKLLNWKKLVDDIVNSSFPTTVHLSHRGKELKAYKKIQKKKNRSTNIKSNISIIISIVTFLISCFSSYQNLIYKNKEFVMINEVNESEYYFDGKKLTKEIHYVITNNSEIDVSILRGTIIRGDETYQLTSVNGEMPINITSNSSLAEVYLIEFKISEEEAEELKNIFGINCEIYSGQYNAFLEGDVVNFESKTITSPSLNIKLYTSKETVISYNRRAGASA